MSHLEHAFGESSLPPGVLLPELADVLRGQEYACVTEATNQGTALVIKVPSADIASLRGTMPIHLQQALYQHPAAPVIQMIIHIHDQPDRPIALETFINVDDPQQRSNYAALTTQTELPMLFYDDTLDHRLTKVIPYHQQSETAALLATADYLLDDIPREHFNFDQAKAAVMRASRL